MALLVTNTAEGGTNGVAVTTGNSGGASGDAISTLEGATTPTFSSLGATHGALGYRFDYAGGSNTYGVATWEFASSGRVTARFYVRINPLPTVNAHIGGLRSAGGAVICNFRIAANGRIGIQNAASVLIAASSAPSTFPENTIVRMEVAVTPGTTASNGRLEYAYYLGDSTTPEWSYDSGATQNMGTATVGRILLGRWVGATDARTIDIDSIQVETLTSGFIGPVASSAIPGDVTAPLATSTASSGVPVTTAAMAASVTATRAAASGACGPPAVAGAQLATVTIPLALASGSSAVPAVAGLRAAQAVAPQGLGTAGGTAPTVTALRSAQVAATRTDATTSMAAPGVTAASAAGVSPSTATGTASFIGVATVAGRVAATAVAPLMTSTASARVPLVLTGLNGIVAPPVGLATGAFTAPSVQGLRVATVVAATSSASALLRPPVATTGQVTTVQAALATGTASMPAVGVTALRAAVTVVGMTPSTAQMPPPAVDFGQSVMLVAAAATALAAAQVPIITAETAVVGAVVVVPLAPSVAFMVSPSVWADDGTNTTVHVATTVVVRFGRTHTVSARLIPRQWTGSLL